MGYEYRQERDSRASSMTRTRTSKSLFKAGLLSILALAPSVSSRCSHNLQEQGRIETRRMLEVVEREQAKGVSKRQGPGTLAYQRTLLDPAVECSAYYYPPVANILSQFPTIWTIASIVPGDTEAQNAFNAIVNDPAFPNLAPKGTPTGDFSAVQYDHTDPDCWWTWSTCTTPKHANIPTDITSCPEPHTWGLTFDDGPNCTHNAFYNSLQEHQFTATMYMIGSNVINWPLQAQRALADGHELAIHTWSHHYSTGLTNEQMFAELWYTRKAIKDVTGVTATAWRAPFGDVDDRIRFIGNALGLSLQLWDEDTDDWKVVGENNPAGLPTSVVLGNYGQIYAKSQQGQFNDHGAIVLTHEINGHTMDIAMSEFAAIIGNFQNIVPVTTCLNQTHPYLEKSYTFPTFEQWISGQNKTLNGTSYDNTSTSTSSSSATPTTASLRSSSVSSGSTTATSSSSSSASSTKAVAAADSSSKSSSASSAAFESVSKPLLITLASSTLLTLVLALMQ